MIFIRRSLLSLLLPQKFTGGPLLLRTLFKCNKPTLWVLEVLWSLRLLFVQPVEHHFMVSCSSLGLGTWLILNRALTVLSRLTFPEVIWHETARHNAWQVCEWGYFLGGREVVSYDFLVSTDANGSVLLLEFLLGLEPRRTSRFEAWW